MKDWQGQAHLRWDCKYHVLIVPQYRQRVFFGKRRKQVGEILRDLCRQKEIDLLKGNAQPDHIHMLVSTPPRYSVAMTMGFLKGKSAVRIHRKLMRMHGTLFRRSFWSRGYCVSTVGLDEAMIRKYIQEQEKHESDQKRGLLVEERGLLIFMLDRVFVGRIATESFTGVR